MGHVTLYAGLGKTLRRISDGMDFGSEITLGYTYYLGGNKLDEINPYSLKQSELGNTSLEHNPILNPVFNYKYNKYLFPQTESSLQRVGYEIAK